MPTEIQRLGVAGGGQMGSGIAQIAVQAGLEVYLYDITEALARAGAEAAQKRLARMAERGNLSAAAAQEASLRIHPSAQIEAFAHAQFVIEAIAENEPAKAELFNRLNGICPPETILASNTSSISITRLGLASGRPPRFIGMHFMNPPPVMKLVEIIRGLETANEAHAATRDLAERLGKTVITVEDSPGFVVNRVLLPMINEAIFALQEGVGSAPDIDTGMRLGTNQPMGPLELADLIGLDTCLAILEVLHRGLGEDKYRPCALLRKYVDAGFFGRKSGRGFYLYGRDGKKTGVTAASISK